MGDFIHNAASNIFGGQWTKETNEILKKLDIIESEQKVLNEKIGSLDKKLDDYHKETLKKLDKLLKKT